MQAKERQPFWRAEHAALTQRVLLGCVRPCPPRPQFNNVDTLHWAQTYRQRVATHWVPHGWREPVLMQELRGPVCYFPNTGSLPRYAGHVPGITNMVGLRFSVGSRFAKSVLEGDFNCPGCMTRCVAL